MVFNAGDADMSTDAISKRARSHLHAVGYAPTPKPAGQIQGRQDNPEVVVSWKFKNVSNAPGPIKPTSGTTGGHRDPENMSQREYERFRRKVGYDFKGW